MIVVHNTLAVENRASPSAAICAPAPIAVAVAKRKVYGVHATRCMPCFQPNQERTGEDNVAITPTSAIHPRFQSRAVQFAKCCESLTNGEFQERREGYPESDRLIVPISNPKSNGTDFGVRTKEIQC